MQDFDDIIKRYGTISDANSYTNRYDFDDEEENDECVTADLYADGHTLTFELNNFEYTSYCDSIREFKKELWQQIEEIIDECIFESLQKIDDDEDAEG